ncbi:MAG TPA: diacylglycerol kinase family protein [Naasia sp.]
MTSSIALLGHRQTALPHTPRPGVGTAAVVVNPAKFESPDALGRFQTEVERALDAEGWLPPVWLPTTPESGGKAETRSAVAAGVDVVLIAGGDGTVRTVAQELAGSGLPIGLLPSGTGNLLARNLGIPLGDVPAAVRLACGGGSRPVDIGWLELDPADDGGSGERFAFTVMAGAGFDAAIMSGASTELKYRLGPVAYLVAATRALGGRMVEATLSVDGAEELSRSSRGFVVGNCGTLTMGLALLPEADPADGLLDTVVLLPSSLPQWARAAWSVVTRRRAHRLLPHFRGRRLDFRAATPQLVEVDGDVVGEARHVRVRIQRGAVLVRCAVR